MLSAGWTFSFALAAWLASAGVQLVPWRQSYAAGISEAQESGKLLLLDFVPATDFGGLCQKMDALTFTDPKVLHELSRFIPVKIDAQTLGNDLARQYKVSGFPTVLIADSQGREVGRLTGFLFPGQFNGGIERIIDAHLHFHEYLRKYIATQRNAFVDEHLATIYAMKGDLGNSLGPLGQALIIDPSNKHQALAGALNAVGDCYLNETPPSLGTAASYYLRASQCPAELSDLSYAGERLAQCYLFTGHPLKARTALDRALRLKGLGQAEKAAIQSMLDTASQELHK